MVFYVIKCMKKYLLIVPLVEEILLKSQGMRSAARRVILYALLQAVKV
jgi:hypothetical protein